MATEGNNFDDDVATAPTPYTGNDDDDEEMPHYMLPNFSSILPEFANTEADHIRSAFSSGNYHSLLKVPVRLAPNAVNQSRYEQMEENRLGQQKVGKIVTKHGLFNQFEYTPSRYSLADELAQMERLQSEAKRMEISGQDFVSGSDAKKLKYEDAFGDTGFRYPHLEEPYPDLRDEERHKKWLEEKKILHGAFVPSGHRLPVDAMTRKLLPDIIKEMHEVLSQDWAGVEFAVAPTEDDNISVRFSENSIESEVGLIAFMNVFCRSHRVALKYNLQKVAEDWNSKPGDGGLYFVFRPPWVKNRARELLPLAAVIKSNGARK
ncbi:TPA: hypothetical protein N0F65_003572 [Lagenidium giganteum]|uniref:Uncharacterized protein n=1 Tax=Lagenidium giganteum TaxID=4803 RepID=A0AAV2YZX8_9STRA|nr:TPA: hypothetical protein N0F65_003572 [Lagenidium giganteum]